MNVVNEDGKLSALCFNMKLRIVYLEEKLRKVGCSRGKSTTVDSLEKQLFEMRLTAEERGQEVFERNQLLVKARKAIENLQADVILARERLSESEQQQRTHTTLQQQVLALEARECSRVRDISNLSAKVHGLASNLSEVQRSCEAHVRNLAMRDKALVERDAQLGALRATVARLREENEFTSAAARELVSEKDRGAQLVDDVARLKRELEDRSAALGVERAAAQRLKHQAEAIAKLEAEEIAHLKGRIRLVVVVWLCREFVNSWPDNLTYQNRPFIGAFCFVPVPLLGRNWRP